MIEKGTRYPRDYVEVNWLEQNWLKRSDSRWII